MNLAGGIAFLLFVAIGGYLTWPSAQERAANDSSERRWLGEAGFHGSGALLRLRLAQAAFALVMGVPVAAIAGRVSAPAAVVWVCAAAAISWAIPTALVEARRKSGRR